MIERKNGKKGIMHLMFVVLMVILSVFMVPSVMGQAITLSVPSTTSAITIDGNIGDWATYNSATMHIDFTGSGTGGTLSSNIRFAWDGSFLYFLVQETTAPTAAATSAEATSVSDFTTGPWSRDCMVFWVDLDNDNDNNTGAGINDYNPWFAFSSGNLANMMINRINNDATLTMAGLQNAQTATKGTYAAHTRVIEGKMKWTDIASAVTTSRQPGGNLIAAVKAGYLFGCDPLVIQVDYNKQTFIGGGQYVAPSGTDANSRKLLLAGPASVELWDKY